MTLEEYKSTLILDSPPESLIPLLKALWYDANGDWDKAHKISQSVHTARGSWVHAYLHRKEGDLSNASYWYARAGRDLPLLNLKDEWEKIVLVLLSIA
jgi:hypothetical protein